MRIKFLFLQIALAVAAMLAASVAKADEMVQINWTDTVTGAETSSPTEMLSGSLVFDETTLVVSDITTAMSGSLLQSEFLDESSSGFMWELEGSDGVEVASMLVNGNSLWGDWTSDPFGNDIYFNAPIETLTLMSDPVADGDPPADPPTGTDPPVSTPEPSSVLLSAMGMVALMGLSLLNDRDKTS